jgi:hypothetical protein
MAENKTKATDESVKSFLDGVEDEQKRADAYALLDLMQEVTGEEARMWGTSMVGFGSYHYKYASGREGDAMLAGFSPRKQNLTMYIMAGFDEYESLLDDLGKFKTGKSCLYVKRLSDVDEATLRTLIERSVAHMRATNPPSE